MADTNFELETEVKTTSVKTREADAQLSKLACTSIIDQIAGDNKIIITVEFSGGVYTQEKLEIDGTDEFKKIMDSSAKRMLEVAKAMAKGGGDPEKVEIKYKTVM